MDKEDLQYKWVFFFGARLAKFAAFLEKLEKSLQWLNRKVNNLVYDFFSFWVLPDQIFNLTRCLLFDIAPYRFHAKKCL